MFDSLSAADLDRDTVAGATAEELFDLVRDFHRQRQQLDRAEATVLAEIDRRDVTDRELGLRTPAWMARETGVPPAVAKKRVKVATMLRRWFPAFAAALAEGRIGWDHVRLLCDVANPRIVAQFAELQESLLELAAGVGFDPWAQQIRALAELLDEDGGHDPNRDLERNQLSFTRTTDGITHLRGMLLGELGLTFDQAVTVKTDALALQYARDHEGCPEIEIPSRTSLQALALVELLRQAAGVDIASSNPPVAEVVLRVAADDLTTKTDLNGVRLQDGDTDPAVRRRPLRHRRQQLGRTARSGATAALRQRPPAPHVARTRRRVHLPRLRPPTALV